MLLVGPLIFDTKKCTEKTKKYEAMQWNKLNKIQKMGVDCWEKPGRDNHLERPTAHYCTKRLNKLTAGSRSLSIDLPEHTVHRLCWTPQSWRM